MKENNYTAMIVDVVNSKKYEEREQIQKYLKNIIQYNNLVFAKSLHKQMLFSAGDEIQGLFKNPLAAYLCARMFMMLAYPIKVRVGMGYGSIAYENESWTSTELDGVAYHRAREAIESFNEEASFGIRFNAHDKKDQYINSLLYASQLLQRQQSKNVQQVKLVAELIFPIYEEEQMVFYLSYRNQMQELLEERVQLCQTLIGKGNKEEMFCLSYLDEQIEKQLSEVVSQNQLMVRYVWKNGMNTAIAQVLHSSRQNISQHVKQGKIEENRVIDFTIASYFREVQDE